MTLKASKERHSLWCPRRERGEGCFVMHFARCCPPLLCVSVAGHVAICFTLRQLSYVECERNSQFSLVHISSKNVRNVLTKTFSSAENATRNDLCTDRSFDQTDCRLCWFYFSAESSLLHGICSVSSQFLKHLTPTLLDCDLKVDHFSASHFWIIKDEDSVKLTVLGVHSLVSSYLLHYIQNRKSLLLVLCPVLRTSVVIRRASIHLLQVPRIRNSDHKTTPT